LTVNNSCGRPVLVRVFAPLFIAFALGGCMKSGTTPESREPETPPAGSAQPPGQETDWKAIEQLETEAKAIAKIDGCSVSGDCRSAPVGAKACGGPRYYLTYCGKTTDSTALQAKLDEVAKAETAYNKKYSAVSTCEMRLPPELEAVGGSCRAK